MYDIENQQMKELLSLLYEASKDLKQTPSQNTETDDIIHKAEEQLRISLYKRKRDEVED